MFGKAADITTRSPVTVTVTFDETNVQPAQKFVEHGISAMPVCNVAGHVMGLLNEADLMWPFRQSVLQKRTRWLCLLAEGDRLSACLSDYDRNNNSCVGESMISKVISASEEATLSDLAELMARDPVKRIPILRGKTLVGIVDPCEYRPGVGGKSYD